MYFQSDRNKNQQQPVYEFHISRERREFYGFDETLFAQSGNIVFINFAAVREFAVRMNRKRDLINFPEQSVKAGQLNAMGLIDEILHFIVGLYREEVKKDLFDEFARWLTAKTGAPDIRYLLKKFTEDFPPPEVYTNRQTAEEYLSGQTAGAANRDIVLEELLLFYLANANPAFHPFRELFDDMHLAKETIYHQYTKYLPEFFETQPKFGPENQTLFEMLRAPAVRHPNSLTDQLEFIRTRWGTLLSKFILRLLGSLDFIREEEKAVFGGPGPMEVIDYRKAYGGEDEYERFSTDLDWMPKVVMIAKSTYVWLDQLSKRYQRSIVRLDQIPDEELDRLAAGGFTALWLIGLWERSPASQKIKQMCGNPEAVSSAYSVYDYTIAGDLGGEPALHQLRQRAWQRGIRVASDMVPNHTGIYSRWVIEQPDWFIQSSHPVFPGYSFNGPNLSHDDRVGLYIEDGYWNRTDAAVVFKRVDHHTGETRYIYHGNDGTSMPWNDTAQLNYLLPQVREAVIQMILQVARDFPIIRLDAAMTITKRHFQRLWFPQPGTGGDIPSRAEFGMSKEEFDRAFPQEFWREVVDRVAEEVPDTLLLAEAFWMMEGYFVRTLGMHRVYNSAFMNMLKNEDNQKYRQTIKNVMDFNAEILKRYVNFMNNPDEDTAVAQFGRDDKYFGVCILMITMPGLPMFGHGQIEGFTEKYGMEYRRAYWDEAVDTHLVSRHEREIFPLLKKRYLFSEVVNFVLYDFQSVDGHINENVFAYSNRSGHERALIIYNNKYDRTTGHVRYSSASAQKENGGFRQYNLRSGLSLNPDTNHFTIFRDHISGLEFIRRNESLDHNGIYVELDGFKYHVFVDFREVADTAENHYSRLHDYLNGRGVPSIEDALRETFLMPVHSPFRRLLSPEFLKDAGKLSQAGGDVPEFVTEAERLVNEFLTRLTVHINRPIDVSPWQQEITRQIIRMLEIAAAGKSGVVPEYAAHVSFISQIAFILVRRIGGLQDIEHAAAISVSWLNEMLLSRLIQEAMRSHGLSDDDAFNQILLVQIMIEHARFFEKMRGDRVVAFRQVIQDQTVNRFLRINRYQEHLYLHKESLETVLYALHFVDLLDLEQPVFQNVRKRNARIRKDLNEIRFILETAEKAGFRLDRIQNLLSNKEKLQAENVPSGKKK